MKVAAIILAAGNGSRMNSNVKAVYRVVGEACALAYNLCISGKQCR